mmetsp:Transcript_44569/g.118255  ORF Transcript_44569/g.118255 Transcript_44569/m.118255 type:complete len:208 (-) Transcript_44569:73-696(-)
MGGPREQEEADDNGPEAEAVSPATAPAAAKPPAAAASASEASAEAACRGSRGLSPPVVVAVRLALGVRVGVGAVGGFPFSSGDVAVVVLVYCVEAAELAAVRGPLEGVDHPVVVGVQSVEGVAVGLVLLGEAAERVARVRPLPLGVVMVILLVLLVLLVLVAAVLLRDRAPGVAPVVGDVALLEVHHELVHCALDPSAGVSALAGIP